MRMSLPSLALRRPVTVLMLACTLVGLGIIAWTRMPIEFIPKLSLPFVACIIPYPGATPEQVENEIAIPAEGEFRTITNLKRITTNSTSNGCSVQMQFDLDTDMTLATAEVRDRIERLKLTLPNDVDNVLIQKFSDTMLPIMLIALFWDDDEQELAHIARTVIHSRVMRLDGVANVEVVGRPDREVLIEFDQSELRSRNVSMYDVVGRLQQSSLNLTIGEINEGKKKHFVRVVGEYVSPDEIAALIVGPNSLRVRDVADVGYRMRTEEHDFSIDGRSGVFLMIQKESEANTISTCNAVRAEIEKFKSDPDLRAIDTYFFFDQADMIVAALDGLKKAGKFGCVLAVSVLFLFLLRVRPTLIVALSIPTSLVIAFVYMFFAGMTLNIVTMCSMIVALGMLVDNAIVVIENIDRHGKLGCSPREASERGASEVGLAITASTLTTVIVFLPILYLESGEMSTYMQQFAAPICVALIGSLLVALTLIPLATSRLRPRSHYTSHPLLSRIAARLQFDVPGGLKNPRLLKKIVVGYGTCLEWTLRRRVATTLLILLLLVVTVRVTRSSIKQVSAPEPDTRQIEIEVDLEQNFDMAMAREHMNLLTTAINKRRDELGVENVFVNFSPTGGLIRVCLKDADEFPDETPPYSTKEAEAILSEWLPGQMPGTEVKVAAARTSQDSGTGLVTVKLRGDDIRTLTSYADRFKALMDAIIPEITGGVTDAERARKEIQLSVDEDLIQQGGISPLIIARTVDFALRGARLPYLKQGGREVPVWAQFREEDRMSRGNLDNVALLSPTGDLMPLNRFVSFDKSESPQSIRRENGKNVINITARVDNKDLTQVKQDLAILSESFDMPNGYSIEMGNEIMKMEEDMSSFITAMLLSLVLVYLVMGALFESFLLPLSILTTVPLAIVGVLWSLYITDTPLDVVAMIGIVFLNGLVVNNGIVIIDYINQQRRLGMSRHDAIVKAGFDRFRPVMMTALTTILGCVPLAIGGGSGNQVAFTGLGRVFIGGMTSGTFLTLFIVPLFYTFFDDLQTWFLRYLANIASIGKRRAVTDSAPAK